MDSFYNKETAAKVLDDVIAARTRSSSSPQMYSMDMEAVAKFGLSIGKEMDGVASKLIQQNEHTGETEEATVALQGIISAVRVPPFEIKNRRSDEGKRLPHIRQSLTITGLGSNAFKQIVTNFRHTYSMFSRYTPNAKLISVPEFIGKDERLSDDTSKNTTITASNRFFTPVKQAEGFRIVDIGGEIDPRGILENVDKKKWVHTEDNEVAYYVLGTGDDEGSYKPTTSIIFQVGDIVELQVSLICIPTKGDYTVKVVLRSVVLLNGELTTEATTARTLAIDLPPTVPPRRLKRRNPYAANSGATKAHARVDVEGADADAGMEQYVDATIDHVL
ncbi:hypothetical protein AB1N83_012392 [Pleurotus pulmonarius]